MRLGKSRKASAVYPVLIALAGLLAILACWYILLDKSSSFESSVGESQFAMIKQYQEGEDYLFFMDQAAEYSAYESVRRLAGNGGYQGGSDCGEIGGYTLWTYGGMECYPSEPDILLAFESEFNILINEYSTLSYLSWEDRNIYTLEYSGTSPLSFIAKPWKYTDFVTKVVDKDAELPPGATSTKLDGGKILINYAELGQDIDYGWYYWEWVN